MKFQIWKTITLGTYKSPWGYYEALRQEGFLISIHATSEILNKIQIAEVETEIDLVVVSVTDLGFVPNIENPYGTANRSRIYTGAEDFGLERCPAEVGLALRRSYPDQPYSERLHIAMKPIPISLRFDIALRIFDLYHGFDGGCDLGKVGLWLNVNDGGLHYPWPGWSKWIFSLPRHK